MLPPKKLDAPEPLTWCALKKPAVPPLKKFEAAVYERVTYVIFTADMLNVTGAAIPSATQVLNGETLQPMLVYVRFGSSEANRLVAN